MSHMLVGVRVLSTPDYLPAGAPLPGCVTHFAMAAEVLEAVVDAMQAQAQVRDLHVQVHGCTVLRNVSCASAMTQRRRPSSCRLANAGGVWRHMPHSRTVTIPADNEAKI